MKSAIEFIPSKYRWPAYALGGMVMIGLVGRLFADVPTTEVYEVENASIATTEEPEPLPIADPYESCRLAMNSALVRYSNAVAETQGTVTQGRAQDWRRWARERAMANGTSEVQELRAAFSALTARLDADHLTQLETVGGELLPIDLLIIDGSAGEYRDLELARQDVATALITAQTTPYESVSTGELKAAAMEFLDASGCLNGMEVVNAE